MLEQFGFDPAELHVAPRLGEAHTAMRSLLDSGQADMDGRFHRYHAVFTNARAVSDRVPLLLGAMGGSLTFRLAGEIADGVYASCSSRRRPSTTSSATSGAEQTRPGETGEPSSLPPR